MNKEAEAKYALPLGKDELLQHLKLVLEGKVKPAFANNEIPRILSAVSLHEALLNAGNELAERYRSFENFYAERTGIKYDAKNGSIRRWEAIAKQETK